MKQNLINISDSTPKSGNLSIALYPNALQKENGAVTKYYARVVNRSRLGIEDIVNDLLSDGGNIRKSEALELWNEMTNAIAMRITAGLSVDIGIGVLYPVVGGAFESAQSGFDAKKHTISVQYRPTAQIKEAMSRLVPVITRGNFSSPEVTRVADRTSGWDSAKLKEGQTKDRGTLTPGGFLIIEGKSIRLAGEGATVGLYFEDVENPKNTARLSAADLLRNDSSLLECTVPDSLVPGSTYRLRVVTQYLRGGKFRVQAQEYTCATMFSAKC